MIYLVTAALSLPTGSTPPTFAKDFYVGTQDSIALNQGGYYVKDGMCCSMEHASQCKLQGISMGSDYFEQGTTNRSRADSAQGSTVQWYSIKKEMAVVPGAQVNSTHKWACAAYCPIDDEEFESILQIGDGETGPYDTPKDLGQETITQPAAIGGASKVCEHWQWSETIFKKIKMATHDFFVDNSASPVAPFFQHMEITPFGGASIGQENTSFIGYQAMDVSDKFDIDPDSVTNCQMSDQCQPPSPPAQFSPRHEAVSKLLSRKTLLQQARERVPEFTSASEAILVRDDPTEPNITFIKDFTSHENTIEVIAQGPVSHHGADPCCSSDAPGQCQVQVAHRAGMRYLDVTNQRTRFDDTVGMQSIVDDYTVHKTILVNVTNGVETCQEYCPIDPQDTLEPIDPFDPFDTTKDLGPVTFGGKPAEHYQWKDMILKVIQMSITDFYADISDKKAAVPLFSSQALTPFGQTPPIGVTNQTWSNFTAGTPTAAKFNIAGVATCPMSSQCQQSEYVLHAMRAKQHHTLAARAKALHNGFATMPH